MPLCPRCEGKSKSGTLSTIDEAIAAIGTIGAVAGLLEQSINLFERLHDAAKRQKERPELLNKYSEEVSATYAMVELVNNEHGLNTDSIHSAISKLGKVAEALYNHLQKMDSVKGRFRGFIHQLTSGKKAEEALKGIMGDLGNAKVDLGIYINISNVGIIERVGDAVHVNTTTVEAMNTLLREKLGSGHVLKISEVLSGKIPNSDGIVTLTREDIALLSKQEAVAASKASSAAGDKKSRFIVKDNKAALHALQVNTPIGMDVWKDMDIFIEGNTAGEGSIQLNAPISSADFAKALQYGEHA